MLLLPGGLNRAGSYEELMAQLALAEVRLVAATLPGHGGTPHPPDFSIQTPLGSPLSLPRRSTLTSW